MIKVNNKNEYLNKMKKYKWNIIFKIFKKRWYRWIFEIVKNNNKQRSKCECATSIFRLFIDFDFENVIMIMNTFYKIIKNVAFNDNLNVILKHKYE